MQAGVDFEERDIFKHRLSREELVELARMRSVDELFAWRSPSAREYRSRRGRLSDDALLDLMAAQPRLVRRPLLAARGRLTVGFDPGAYERLNAPRRP